MTCTSTILLLIFILNKSFCLYDADSGVKILSKTNFNKFIKREKLTLVEFYAPWCGHCKSLKPEYIKAAKDLKGIVTLAAVDANDEKNREIASKYEIKGFPTLKLFKDGKPSEFNFRDAKSIIETLKKELSDNYLTVITVENSNEFFGLNQKKIVLFGKEEKPDALFKSLSMRFYKQLRFGFVPKENKELAKKFKVKKFPTSFVVEEKKGEEEPKTEEIEKYVAGKMRSKILSILGSGYNEYENLDILHDHSCLHQHCIAGGNICVFFVESGKPEEIAKYKNILQEAREELVDESFIKFVSINGTEHRDYLRQIFGEKIKLTFPRVFLVSYKKKVFSPFRKAFEKDALVEFLSSFTSNNQAAKVFRFKTNELPIMAAGSQLCGEIKAIKKSRSRGDKKESIVVTVTEKNFDTVVGKSKVPVFVEFYAPWCGHCKHFAPDYEKIASKLQNTVLFTKVDATTETNLAQKYGIKGYPTIKFSKSPLIDWETKKDISLEDYKGGRSVTNLISKSKEILKELSKVSEVKEGQDSFEASLEEKFEGIKIYFTTKEKKSDYIINAVSIYFAEEKKLKFYHLPTVDEEVVKVVGAEGLTFFAVEEKEDGKKAIYQYKKKLLFANLVKNIQALVESKEEDINANFDYGEILLPKEELKKEL